MMPSVAARAERIGRRFDRYRAERRGEVAPARPVRKSERTYRLEEVATWLASRWFGASRRAILTAFDQYYPLCVRNSASEQRYYRDLRALLGTSKFVRVGRLIVRADRAKAIS